MLNSSNLLSRFCLFFLLAYSLLFCFSTQFIFSSYLNMIWSMLVPQFASLIGETEEVVSRHSGSGDTLFDYYKLALFAFVSILIGAVATWSLPKKTHFSTLLKYGKILFRYYIAAQMINYGLAKLFYMQFSAPSISRLDQTFGESSPMGLLWTFMGFSKGYTMFTGFAELLGGLFLLSRRTSTLGALITFGVMFNVMMMNYCYDVPVKLLSTQMVLFSGILIALEGNRIFRFFFNVGEVPEFKTEDIVSQDSQKVKTILKCLFLFGYLGYTLFRMIEMSQSYGPSAEDKPLTGAYRVTKFEAFRNGEPRTNISNSEQWKLIYNNNYGWARIKSESGSQDWQKFVVDTLKQSVHLSTRNDTIGTHMNYHEKGDTLFLFGRFYNDSLHVECRKKNKNEYLLNNRGFHWVQEYPFNR